MVFILTVDEMLDLGIEYDGFDEAMHGRVKPQRNVVRFLDWYGSHPVVCLA
jgi:hypothetical protein